MGRQECYGVIKLHILVFNNILLGTVAPSVEDLAFSSRRRHLQVKLLCRLTWCAWHMCEQQYRISIPITDTPWIMQLPRGAPAGGYMYPYHNISIWPLTHIICPYCHKHMVRTLCYPSAPYPSNIPRVTNNRSPLASDSLFYNTWCNVLSCPDARPAKPCTEPYHCNTVYEIKPTRSVRPIKQHGLRCKWLWSPAMTSVGLIGSS